jgi:multiple sugar transport system substrate-binding protein
MNSTYKLNFSCLKILLISLLLLFFSLSNVIIMAQESTKALEPVTLNIFVDGGINVVPYDMARDNIEKITGIKLNINPVAQVDVYPKLKNEFVSGAGAFDIVTYPPKYEAEFANLNNIQPMDPFIDIYDPKLEDIPESLRELYCMYNGKLYSLPYDGDLHIFYYRKDLIEDPTEQKNFKEEYGYELGVPRTWEETLDFAEFFTRKKGETLAGEVLEDDFFGHLMMLSRLWNIYEFIDRFAAYQGQYFDEDLNAAVNSEAGIKALTLIKELLKYAPEESLSYGYFETRNSFLGGNAASMLQFTDVFKFSYDASQSVVQGKVGISHIPGSNINGELYYKGTMPYGRIMSITSSTKHPREAYWVIAYMSAVESLNFTFDPRTGEDPFRYSHINSPEYLSEYLSDFSGGAEVPVEDCANYLEAIGESFASAYPEFCLPGSELYMDALSLNVHKALSGELTVKEALDQCAQQWDETSDSLGREAQKEIWNGLLIAWRKLGLID